MEIEVPMNQSMDRAYITPGEDSQSLSAQQRRFWVLDQLERTDAPHNVPAGLDIRGTLDLATLEKAIRVVLERHDVLRSRFVLENDEPRAVISSSGFQSLPVVSLTQMPEPQRRQAASALAVKELHQAFDLQSGPLFRATLYQLSDTEHLLALTLHKIICDSVSSLILTRKLLFVTIASSETHRCRRRGLNTSTTYDLKSTIFGAANIRTIWRFGRINWRTHRPESNCLPIALVHRCRAFTARNKSR